MHERCYAGYANDACFGEPLDAGVVPNARLVESTDLNPWEEGSYYLEPIVDIEASPENPVPLWVDYGARYYHGDPLHEYTCWDPTCGR